MLEKKKFSISHFPSDLPVKTHPTSRKRKPNIGRIIWQLAATTTPATIRPPSIFSTRSLLMGAGQRSFLCWPPPLVPFVSLSVPELLFLLLLPLPAELLLLMFFRFFRVTSQSLLSTSLAPPLSGHSTPTATVPESCCESGCDTEFLGLKQIKEPKLKQKFRAVNRESDYLKQI